MKKIKDIGTKLAVLAGVVGLSFYSLNAMAATQSMTANISFDTPVSLVKVADISFGFVTAGQANTYKIDTAAAVTVTGGAGSGVWLGGTKAAGNITISGSTTQTVSILANNYAVVGGVTPSLATCKYDGGAETSCNVAMTAQTAPGAGKTLLVGISATANGTQAAGAAAAPTFDVVVVYG